MRTTTPAGPTPVSVPLALLSDLRADLGIAGTDEDDRLTRLLLSASETVAAYIGRPILSQAWQDVFFLSANEWRSSLTLSHWPVSEIKSLSWRGEAFSLDAIAALPVNGSAGIICPPDGQMMWRPGRYQIVYQAGWAAPGVSSGEGVALPETIQRAVRIMAAADYHATGRDPLLKSESETGVGASSWQTPTQGTGGMPLAAAELLDSYQSGSLA